MKLTVAAPLSTVWECFWKSEHVVNWCFASDDWHCQKSVSPKPEVGAVFSHESLT